MSSASQGLPSQPTSSETQSLAPGPVTLNDLRSVFTAVDIFRSLGRLEDAVDGLKATTKSHTEKIEQLTHKTDRAAFAIPNLRKAVAQNTTDLNQLGQKRVAKLENFAYAVQLIAVVSATVLTWIFTYLWHK
jgi:ABC-type transporter Mla subunit MlaD